MATIRKGSIVSNTISSKDCPRDFGRASAARLNGHAFVSEEESHILVKVFLQPLTDKDKVYFSVKDKHLMIRTHNVSQVIHLPKNVNEGGVLAEYYGKFLRIVIPKVAIH